MQRPRRVDRDDVPDAVEALALRAGHEVGDGAAGLELVAFEGRRSHRRPPPALELARVGPQLPHALQRRIELGSDGQGAGVEVLVDVGDGHWGFPSSERTSDMRATRPRHRSSSSSSARRARPPRRPRCARASRARGAPWPPGRRARAWPRASAPRRSSSDRPRQAATPTGHRSRSGAECRAASDWRSR